MGATIDAVFFWLGVAVVGCALGFGLLLALGLGLLRASGLNPPDGGSETPPAWSGPSHEATSTMRLIHPSEASFSSPTALGRPSEDEAILQWHREASRSGAPTPCGCKEAGSPGQPLRDAASERRCGLPMDHAPHEWDVQLMWETNVYYCPGGPLFRGAAPRLDSPDRAVEIRVNDAGQEYARWVGTDGTTYYAAV